MRIRVRWSLQDKGVRYLSGHLFSEWDLRKVLEGEEQQMLKRIEEYPAEKLLNSSEDDLVEYFATEASVPMVELREDEIVADQTETTADARYLPDRHVFDPSRPVPVPAVRLTLSVPFDGEEDLFKCGSAYDMNPPRGVVVPGMLTLSQTRTDHDAKAARAEFDKTLNAIRERLRRVAETVEPWNAGLAERARAAIKHRRERLLKDRGLIADLGFPIRRRDGGGSYSTPTVRRRAPIRPKAPPGTGAPFKPEPALDQKEYEHILEVITATAIALERSPATFARMDEEELRDQFLVPLNSHYEGQATGETFNASGKTDILIRAEGRAIFIAECKIWRGPKVFLAALDQLLSYTTWRDTKTALLVFNRNKNFSAVLEQLRPLAETHENYKRTLRHENETGFRVTLGHPDDPAREIIVTVLAFDVPE